MKHHLFISQSITCLMRGILVLVVSCTVFSCNSNETTAIEQDKTTEIFSSNEDLFPHKVSPQLAKHFSVSYHGNYKIVKTDATFAKGKETEGELHKDLVVLVQRGTNPPALEGDLKHATIIYVPVETAAVNVQHSESFLRELGLENRINAIGGLYSYDDKMRNKALSGEIGQVGYSWHSPPNIEILLERQADVFLMTMASLDHKTSLDKCRQFNIPTAPVFDWAEENYLARAEWIKFYSLFFNAEERANQVFEMISDRISEIKALSANITDPKPALWGYYIDKQEWAMSISSFPAQYMSDAGLDNILLENTKANANGTSVLSTEELLVKGKEVEHWIIGDIHASPLPKENIMSSFGAWNAGQLYHNMGRVDPKTNTSDWYATAIVRPDTVVADLMKLAYPELLPDHQPVFMGYYDKATQAASSK